MSNYGLFSRYCAHSVRHTLNCCNSSLIEETISVTPLRAAREPVGNKECVAKRFDEDCGVVPLEFTFSCTVPFRGRLRVESDC
eukprot:IDg20706t1